MTGADNQVLLNAALRQDLGTFIAKVFQMVSPGDRYLHNWHIDAIVHELMQVHRGENRRLIITQPPRSLKSICTSVAYVAWCLGMTRACGLHASPTLMSSLRPLPVNSAPLSRATGIARCSPTCGSPRTPRPNA